MGHYIYDLSKEESASGYTTAEDFANQSSLNFGAHNEGFSYCINKFFSDKDIVRCVKEGEWNEVFEYWTNDYSVLRHNAPGKFCGNSFGWSLELLLAFLDLAGIDFCDGLEYDANYESIEPLTYIPDEGEDYD